MKTDLIISVICTNNRPVLEQCLGTLEAACDGLSWEAVVVDNASGDGTAAMVRSRFPWARLIINPVRQGFSANHNQVLRPALKEQRFRYLLVLNDDVLLDPASLAALVSAADRDPSIGAIGPAIRGTDGATQQSLFPFPSLLSEATLMLGLGHPKKSPARGWLNGSCILFRGEALEEVGALDDTFFIFFEDTDISLRLWQAGWRVGLAESATIVHLEHRTVSQPAHGSLMEKQMFRSRYLYFAKHLGPARTAALALVTRVALGARALKALIWGIVTGNPDERATAQLLSELMAYSPTEPLDHETRARDAAPAEIAPAASQAEPASGRR